jgi:hypothetical protein
MATKEERRTDAVSPEQLLVVFSRGRIVLWLAVAVLIHAVAIGATSLTYIRDRWIDPEGARIRKEEAAKALTEAKAREKRAAAAARAATTAAATNAPSPAAGAATGTVAAATGAVSRVDVKSDLLGVGGQDAATLAARTNTATVQRMLQVASSNEIPKAPGLGISLEDTNQR